MYFLVDLCSCFILMTKESHSLTFRMCDIICIINSIAFIYMKDIGDNKIDDEGYTINQYSHLRIPKSVSKYLFVLLN